MYLCLVRICNFFEAGRRDDVRDIMGYNITVIRPTVSAMYPLNLVCVLLTRMLVECIFIKFHSPEFTFVVFGFPFFFFWALDWLWQNKAFEAYVIHNIEVLCW